MSEFKVGDFVVPIDFPKKTVVRIKRIMKYYFYNRKKNSDAYIFYYDNIEHVWNEQGLRLATDEEIKEKMIDRL